MSRAAERVVLGGWIAGFAFGATMHATDFVRIGPFPYTHGPAAANLFWNALLALDLGVCMLLAARQRRAGLALGLAVMLVDVPVNAWATWALRGGEYTVALPMQAGFLGFLLGSVAWLWPVRAGRR